MIRRCGSWTDCWPSSIGDSAATRDDIWRKPQTQSYMNKERDRPRTWYDLRLLAEKANITLQKAGLSDAETGYWRKPPKLVNTRQDCPCDETPITTPATTDQSPIWAQLGSFYLVYWKTKLKFTWMDTCIRLIEALSVKAEDRSTNRWLTNQLPRMPEVDIQTWL